MLAVLRAVLRSYFSVSFHVSICVRHHTNHRPIVRPCRLSMSVQHGEETATFNITLRKEGDSLLNRVLCKYLRTLDQERETCKQLSLFNLNEYGKRRQNYTPTCMQRCRCLTLWIMYPMNPSTKAPNNPKITATASKGPSDFFAFSAVSGLSISL